MQSVTERAYAKLNLSLDVLSRRDDGYHNLRMVMQSVTLCDEVKITRSGGTEPLRLTSDLSFLPGPDRNTAAIAARVFAQTTGRSLDGVVIDLRKRIPISAGTAGGSSDGAAVLRGLNTLFGTKLTPPELEKLGEQVGSDVPYCVSGGTALAEGRGEILSPLPALPDCHIVLSKPSFSVSTQELFRRIDGVRLTLRPDTAGLIAALEQGNLEDVAQRIYNVFEDVLPRPRQEKVRSMKHTLIDCGALGACMSGTGPTVFGLFNDREKAEHAARRLKVLYPETYLTRPI